jgi:hypothetical protein
MSHFPHFAGGWPELCAIASPGIDAKTSGNRFFRTASVEVLWKWPIPMPVIVNMAT